MKFQCSKSDILSNLQQAQNIVGQRTTLAILSNVLMETKGNELTFTSTDLEIGLISSCKVDVLEEGKTTIPARKLFDIIRNLPDQTISMEVDSNNVAQIKCGKSSYKIYGISAEDFPHLPDFSQEHNFEFNQSLLKKLIRQTSFSISRDESRYVLNGIYMVFNASEILGVSTDGRRLSLSRHTGMNFKDMKIDFIIPSKTVSELQKILSDEGLVRVYPKGNQVCFQMGTTTLITKLIEGNFPEYQAVIPENSTQKVIFNKEEFASAIHRVALFTSEKYNSIKLVFSNNRCVISANSPNVGEAREEIEVEFAGAEMPIAFNPNYLLDILKCLDTVSVTMELTDSLKPGVVREGTEFLSVIMPMRLTE